MTYINIINDRANIDAITEQAAKNAVAEVVFEMLPQDLREKLGTENLFGETITKQELTLAAVRAAAAEGQRYKYGATTLALFAPEWIPEKTGGFTNA